MKKILNVYKPIGKTPLEIIRQVRKALPEYQKEKIGYAGRLDPLAHGVLLLMIGEATKERDSYLDLAKVYEFEALLGIETDTYDLLGMLKNTSLNRHAELGSASFNIPKQVRDENFEKKFQSFIQSKLGHHLQPYPPYSSKTVSGKPLFWWARNKKLEQIQIPQKEITIDDFQLLAQSTITTAQLKKDVSNALASVTGDFRQKEIEERWEEFFQNNPHTKFQTARFRIHCSSGTYVRSLVHALGQRLDTGAITREILRTQVGSYAIADALRLEKIQLHNKKDSL